MLPSFSAFETMLEEAQNRQGSWLFEYEEIDRISELQEEFKTTTPEKAIKELRRFIESYFEERNLAPILQISLNPPCATIIAPEGARFILAARSFRGRVKSAKDFESLVATQLSKKLTGQVMCVGYPRKQKPVALFRGEMNGLGINLDGVKRINDGGLDVLWLPPLGKKAEIPFVNFQCKNTETLGDDVIKSVSDARKTLKRHELFTQSEFLIFAVVNTYLEPKMVRDSFGRGCVYLGLPELLTCRRLIHPPVFL